MGVEMLTEILSPKFTKKPIHTERARRLRKNMTGAEKIIWRQLENSQMGVSMRRQHPIGSYVVDFVALRILLVIELDGDQHAFEGGLRHDAIRTRFLESKGYHVMRFWNNDVFENREGVLLTIWNYVQEALVIKGLTPTPTLPLPGRGSISGGAERI